MYWETNYALTVELGGKMDGGINWEHSWFPTKEAAEEFMRRAVYVDSRGISEARDGGFFVTWR